MPFHTKDDSIFSAPFRLSARLEHALRRLKIGTIGQFLAIPMNYWKSSRGIGKKTFGEMTELRALVLDSMGLTEKDVALTMPKPPRMRVARLPEPPNGWVIECLAVNGIAIVGDFLATTDDFWLSQTDFSAKTIDYVLALKHFLSIRPDISRKALIDRSLACFVKTEPLPPRENTLKEELAEPWRGIFMELVSGLGIDSDLAFKSLKDFAAKYELSDPPPCMGPLYDSPFLKSAVKSRVLSILGNASWGMSLPEIEARLPRHLSGTGIAAELLRELLEERKIRKTEGPGGMPCYMRQYLTVAQFVKQLGQEIGKGSSPKNHKMQRNYEIFRKRLFGTSKVTLDAVATKYGVTRERARQICESFLKKRPFLEEDRYLGLFSRYLMKKSEFCFLFNESPATFHYLNLIDKTYNADKLPLSKAILDDPDFPRARRAENEAFLQKVRDKTLLKIDDHLSIPRKRPALIRHVIQTFCRTGRSHADFISAYDRFLVDNGLQGRFNIRNSKAHLVYLGTVCLYVLSGGKKSIRYYDIPSRDYEEFFKEIDLLRYDNSEISARKLFLENRDLMRRYDVQSYPELHNLLKKLFKIELGEIPQPVPEDFRVRLHEVLTAAFGDCSRFKDAFPKNPTIHLGNCSYEDQIRSYLAIKPDMQPAEFARLYERKYGVLVGTVKAAFYLVRMKMKKQGQL